MGKASKKKAQRRQGTGESRAKFEQGRATGRQGPVGLQASKALSELAGIARSLEESKTENVRAWWGGAPVVPATIPQWDAESLG